MTNIVPLTNVLARLDSVRGVTFMQHDAQSAGNQAGIETQIGVIAQKIEQAFPELVTTSSVDGRKMVDYPKLTAILIEAVKELSQRVQALSNSAQTP